MKFTVMLLALLALALCQCGGGEGESAPAPSPDFTQPPTAQPTPDAPTSPSPLQTTPTPQPSPQATPPPASPSPDLTAEPAPSPSPSPSPSASPSPSPAPQLAIPADIEESNFGFLTAAFDLRALAEMGIRWDRPHPGPFVWGNVETTPGHYDWTEIDDYITDSQSGGFGILATVWPFAKWDQAKWDSQLPGSTGSELVFEWEIGRSRRKPYDMDAYRDFVAALVERYDGDGIDDMPGLQIPIKHWEAGNEPSMQEGFNTFFHGSSEDYLEILKATSEAVREADPEAHVLHAGMAGMDPGMVSFWEPIFERGRDYFDIANIHSIGASDELNVPEFAELLTEYGIDKPIWVTEAQHRSGRTFDGRDISAEEHARIMVTSYVLAFSQGVDKIFYTSFRAPPGGGGGEFEQSALIDSYGQPRPAYYAMKTMIAKLDGFTEARRLTAGQYRFTIDGKTVYVLWGEGPVPAAVQGQIILTGMDGTEQVTTATAIALSENPVFIEPAADE